MHIPCIRFFCYHNWSTWREHFWQEVTPSPQQPLSIFLTFTVSCLILSSHIWHISSTLCLAFEWQKSVSIHTSCMLWIFSADEQQKSYFEFVVDKQNNRNTRYVYILTIFVVLQFWIWMTIHQSSNNHHTLVFCQNMHNEVSLWLLWLQVTLTLWIMRDLSTQLLVEMNNRHSPLTLLQVICI